MQLSEAQQIVLKFAKDCHGDYKARMDPIQEAELHLALLLVERDLKVEDAQV